MLCFSPQVLHDHRLDYGETWGEGMRDDLAPKLEGEKTPQTIHSSEECPLLPLSTAAPVYFGKHSNGGPDTPVACFQIQRGPTERERERGEGTGEKCV